MLKLRPHHGMCLLNFTGKGYSDAFTEHMTRTLRQLREHPDTIIEIVSGADDLCAACPNRREDRCESDKPEIFDRNVRENAPVKTGEQIAWAEFRSRTVPLNRDRLEEICPDCQWLSICRAISRSKKDIEV